MGRATLAASILLTLLTAALAAAQQPDEVPLADVLEVLVLDRQLVAVDARGGGQRELALRLDERVLWTGARGRVGVALTDQRVLAVAVGFRLNFLANFVWCLHVKAKSSFSSARRMTAFLLPVAPGMRVTPVASA